ncbi:hypothetical protein [Hyalangium sp.]|uniref:hypothetical protein n=1 Tax=Hyalangium sp. TaxID=2028555 RepID=UPI002D3ED906|nr:hypothetical protein [Hyalangium sp.]HYI00576.1 hypothetical protein [Hyalangium sp.]
MLTPRRVALLWLWLLTGCSTWRHQHPPAPPPPAQASPASCTLWTGATLSWPLLQMYLTAELEAQRARACSTPTQPPTP